MACGFSIRAMTSYPVRAARPSERTAMTVGVLVVAKTPEGFSNLSIQLDERLMERTYYGMVEGHVAEERGIVDAPIGRSTRTPTVMAVRSDGRVARTGYE